MHQWLISAALLAATFSFVASVDAAKDATAASAEVTPKGAAASPGTRAPRARNTAPAKLVDLNSASKADLKMLPGVSEAEADRIIAGRPYRSKADLLTRGIVPAGVYEGVRKQVVAKPKSP